MLLLRDNYIKEILVDSRIHNEYGECSNVEPILLCGIADKNSFGNFMYIPPHKINTISNLDEKSIYIIDA